MAVEDVWDELSSAAEGLSSDEASQRIERTGRNKLTFTRKESAWRVLARQFVSPLIAILAVAAVITLLLQEWADAIAIMVILLLNAAVGFWQEMRAAAEVRALASMSVPECRVIRDGSERTISAEEVVPGDVVLLEGGEQVPADLRLFDARGLSIDESMLTGENVEVDKQADPVDEDSEVADQASMAFSGTLVTSGRGQGVVIATGEHTELGRINELVQGEKAKTPLERMIHGLERRIGLVVGLVAAFVFVVGILGGSGFGQSFLSAVALAVAAIPEALPIVLTIAMALGVRHMAQVNAVVRTLPSVETLGSTTIIGSDKTGTLTRNLMTVTRIWTPGGVVVLEGDEAVESPDGVDEVARAALRAGALTNEANPDEDAPAGFTGDSVDVAMAAAGTRWASVTSDQITEAPLLQTAYEPELGYSQTLRTADDGTSVLYVKGAPDTLIEMSESMLTDDGEIPVDAGQVDAANDEMAEQGLRVLATARRVFEKGQEPTEALDEPEGLTLLGLEGMHDPPREGVDGAIESCRQAGIDVMMITGDHPKTAKAIAEGLGLEAGDPITGKEISTLDDEQLRGRLAETAVAARVKPEDKLRIVKALQDMGHVVAVTGDGVNDAPALKNATIGVAMGETGTEVARESADIVLTDDNFVTIVRAVEQGRVTFAAIRKATFFLLSTAFAVMLAVSTNALTDLPLLFLPIQVLWINVVTNGLQDVALAFEPAEGDELSRPPRRASEGIVSRLLWWRIGLSGLWMGALILASFRWAIENGYAEDHARTLALTMYVALNFFQVGNARTVFRPLSTINPFSNRFLLLTAVGSLFLQWGAMNWEPSAEVLGLAPLSATEWMWAMAIGSTVFVLVEAEKWVRKIGGFGRRYSTDSTGKGEDVSV